MSHDVEGVHLFTSVYWTYALCVWGRGAVGWGGESNAEACLTLLEIHNKTELKKKNCTEDGAIFGGKKRLN